MDDVKSGLEIGAAIVAAVLSVVGSLRAMRRLRRGTITVRSVPTPGAGVSRHTASDDVGRDPYPGQ